MSFIKSIVGWFKRKPEFKTSVNPDQTYKPNPFGLAAHLDKTLSLARLDHDIVQCKLELLSAKRRKKKVSHIHKRLEGLVARKLELEGK